MVGVEVWMDNKPFHILIVATSGCKKPPSNFNVDPLCRVFVEAYYYMQLSKWFGC